MHAKQTEMSLVQNKTYTTWKHQARKPYLILEVGKLHIFIRWSWIWRNILDQRLHCSLYSFAHHKSYSCRCTTTWRFSKYYTSKQCKRCSGPLIYGERTEVCLRVDIDIKVPYSYQNQLLSIYRRISMLVWQLTITVTVLIPESLCDVTQQLLQFQESDSSI